jgi:type I restriction enzyme S subunit
MALQAPSLQRRIATVAKGSTFQEISLEQLRKLEIPVPPITEQRNIASPHFSPNQVH